MSCSERTFSQELPINRGTINVLLANGSGIVALTDSRQSVRTRSGIQPLPQPGQKLFQLDEVTVCTIAGFGGANLPTFPEFTSNSAGILQDFRRELSRHPRQSFRAKLLALSFIFQSRLETIANVRDIASDLADYKFELLLAGYDSDGATKVGWVVLTLRTEDSPTGGLLFSTNEEDIRELTVGRELVCLLGGQTMIASQIMAAPHRFAQDPAVHDFATAYAANHGSSLTVEQMKRLAIALARHTAMSNPTVGGDDQIATLENHRVASFQQAQFPEQPAGKHFPLVVGSSFSRVGQVFGGSSFLIIKSSFENSGQTLDGNFFFGNYFVNSQITYDGGFASFDSTNQVRDCTLVLGPRANQSPAILRHLMDDFGWKEVVRTQPQP